MLENAEQRLIQNITLQKLNTPLKSKHTGPTSTQEKIIHWCPQVKLAIPLICLLAITITEL